MSSYLAEQFGVIAIATRVLLCGIGGQNAMKKTVKFYLEIFEFKVFV